MLYCNVCRCHTELILNINKFTNHFVVIFSDNLQEWDETLASLAQGQAERCVFGHGNLFL